MIPESIQAELNEFASVNSIKEPAVLDHVHKRSFCISNIMTFWDNVNDSILDIHRVSMKMLY